MTIHVSMHLGFVATAESVLRQFRHDRPEQSHMKDRYDPDTGKKVDPVKVVDVAAASGWMISGKFFEGAVDAVDAVGRAIGCRCVMRAGDGFSYVTGPEDLELIDVIFCVYVKHEDDDEEMIDFCVGPSLSLKAILAEGPSLEAIGEKLKKMDIKASGPKVVMSASVG